MEIIAVFLELHRPNIMLKYISYEMHAMCKLFHNNQTSANIAHVPTTPHAAHVKIVIVNILSHSDKISNEFH